MPSAPETRYAKSGDVNIAYQVVGDGPFDLVYVPGWISNIDLMWDDSAHAHLLRRLSGFSRVILFDKRGTGLSDPVSVDRLPTLEQRMDDLRAVMDAAGSTSAALFGSSEGGLMSVLFAATYPERTRALVALAIYAKRIWSPDYPWAPTPEARAAEIAELERTWGSEMDISNLAPSADEALTRRAVTYLRRSASPGAAVALLRMNTQIDVREVLPTIRVPTLVLQRVEDRDVNVEEARWIAKQIPGAKYVELPGDEHLIWAGDVDAVIDEVEEFLTGARSVHEADRVLATVLFTDIVGSTEHAAELGDRRWGTVIEEHHALVRRELERFRGREVDTAGDGFLATFDGPARAIRCACAVRDAVRSLRLEIRAGLHTGECELMGDKVGGIAVHTGARVTSAASPGEVLVSSTVRDLVAGSGIQFEDRGQHELKGAGLWRLYSVVDA
ncbi:MAG: adenylate/guanylate cyclase domain-containing protein [Actinomycetota bacterium]|nr:adenylate/guanylate cyclase domain-containing protein [Actinomycetota bacterium]